MVLRYTPCVDARSESSTDDDDRRAGVSAFAAINPRTGEPTGPEFQEATPQEIDAAAVRAREAFEKWRRVPARDRAKALHAAGDALAAAKAEILRVTDLEAALGEPRITSELARTVAQLHAFADLLIDGSYVEAIINSADPAATPPKPELRRMLQPIGPVAVFTPSNFPLAYGVAGGDTASALAAGCSVVVKGHASQPGTSALCAKILRGALAMTPAGADVLQLIQGRTPDTARAVVNAPEIQAVGFTGSVAAGRALFNVASARPEPIPFYGELGSLNPLFIGPAAVAARADAIATGLAASISSGAGQFCTKPGLVFVPTGDAGDAFVDTLASKLDAAPAGVLLNENISNLLSERTDATKRAAGVTEVTHTSPPAAPGFHTAPRLFVTDASTFEKTPALREEHFGPAAIVIRSAPAEMPRLAASLGGHLTGSIHADAADAKWAAGLADAVTQHVGRLIWNGYPTGVTVVPAMTHGGPYPSSTSSLHSAVGMTAIRRFLRPVSYQNVPDAFLPAELRDANPLAIERLVNGKRTSSRIDT
jgi:NADP-dependent aldehyde dehydrogenase